MKYFYKDPLAAAWMAKHFGMRFQEGYSEHYLALAAASQARDKNESQNYFIHPDSLQLLEPQSDDLILAFDTEFNGITMRWQTLYNQKVDWESRPHNARIVERNGIAFMTPESEAT